MAITEAGPDDFVTPGNTVWVVVSALIAQLQQDGVMPPASFGRFTVRLSRAANLYESVGRKADAADIRDVAEKLIAGKYATASDG